MHNVQTPSSEDRRPFSSKRYGDFVLKVYGAMPPDHWLLIDAQAWAKAVDEAIRRAARRQ